MKTEADLIQYLEQRRQRRNRVAAIIIGVATAIGALTWGVYAAGAKERERNDRTDEIVCAMTGCDE